MCGRLETQTYAERQKSQITQSRARQSGSLVIVNQPKPFNPQWYRNLQTFIVERGLDPETTDLRAYIDPSLKTYGEIKRDVARKLDMQYESGGRGIQGYKYNSQESAVAAPKQFRQNMEREECDRIAESCETYCNNAACRTFKKSCEGDITPCPQKERRAELKYRKSSVAAKGAAIGDCTVRSYCVAPHTRPPQHNSKTGNPIVVKGYCVNPHPRLCRRKAFESNEMYGR